MIGLGRLSNGDRRNFVARKSAEGQIPSRRLGSLRSLGFLITLVVVVIQGEPAQKESAADLN